MDNYTSTNQQTLSLPQNEHQINYKNENKEFTSTSSEEYQNFLKFLNFIKDLDISIPKESKKITDNLKIRVPRAMNLEHFSELYKKTYIVPLKKQICSHIIDKWRKTEISLLVWAIIYYTLIFHISVDLFKDKDWEYISSLFPNRTVEKCKYKWLIIQKSTNQKNHHWTKAEDDFLFEIVGKYKKNLKQKETYSWFEIAAELNLSKLSNFPRLGKHCRERWFNHLDPNISRNCWSKNEDLVLLNKILEFGKKWAFISKQMPGRNENAVKNRFISIIKMLKNDIKDEEDIKGMIKVFNQKYCELSAITKKQKTEVIKYNLAQDISLEQNNESIELKNPIQETTNMMFSNPNINKNKDDEVFKVPIEVVEVVQKISVQKPQKMLIFDIKNENTVFPNIYKNQTFGELAFEIQSSDDNILNEEINQIKENYLDPEEISLKFSSLSISDQYLFEANKILTEIDIEKSLSLSKSIDRKSILSNSSEYAKIFGIKPPGASTPGSSFLKLSSNKSAQKFDINTENLLQITKAKISAELRKQDHSLYEKKNLGEKDENSLFISPLSLAMKYYSSKSKSYLPEMNNIINEHSMSQESESLGEERSRKRKKKSFSQKSEMPFQLNIDNSKSSFKPDSNSFIFGILENNQILEQNIEMDILKYDKI